jgi:hypothetical protein
LFISHSVAGMILSLCNSRKTLTIVMSVCTICKVVRRLLEQLVDTHALVLGTLHNLGHSQLKVLVCHMDY